MKNKRRIRGLIASLLAGTVIAVPAMMAMPADRKSTRLNSSHRT